MCLDIENVEHVEATSLFNSFPLPNVGLLIAVTGCGPSQVRPVLATFQTVSRSCQIPNPRVLDPDLRV